jgi:hypothetical protein
MFKSLALTAAFLLSAPAGSLASELCLSKIYIPHELRGDWVFVGAHTSNLENRMDILKDLAVEQAETVGTLKAARAAQVVKDAEHASDEFHQELFCHGARHILELDRLYGLMLDRFDTMTISLSDFDNQVLKEEYPKVLAVAAELDAAYNKATGGRQ